MTPGSSRWCARGSCSRLLVAAPLLVAALLAGVITSLLGAFTQIQDPAVSLVPASRRSGSRSCCSRLSIGRLLEVFVGRVWPLVVAVGAA